MRAQLSIVIPTLNAESALPDLAATLMEGVQRGVIRDLVITDGESRDATPEIADALGATRVTGPASRGGQLRRGAAAATGEWLLFLHVDSQLPPGWADVVATHMATRDAPAYFQLAFDAAGLAPRLVAGWANLRARLFALPYGDQGLLIQRATYEAVGGFRDIPLMEDVAMARSLARLPGARPHPLPLSLRTSAARYQRDGWLRRGGRNLLLLLRYLRGGDPHTLAKAYRARQP